MSNQFNPTKDKSFADILTTELVEPVLAAIPRLPAKAIDRDGLAYQAQRAFGSVAGAPLDDAVADHCLGNVLNPQWWTTFAHDPLVCTQFLAYVARDLGVIQK